jgi:hypothetical protein
LTTLRFKIHNDYKPIKGGCKEMDEKVKIVENKKPGKPPDTLEKGYDGSYITTTLNNANTGQENTTGQGQQQQSGGEEEGK